MKPILRVYKNKHALTQAVTAQIVRILTSSCRARGRALLCLSGGSSPIDVYQTLALPEFSRKVPWDKVHFFWGDERCVSPDDPESNYKNAADALLNFIPADPEKIHRIKGELPPKEAALDYQKVLQDFSFGPLPWPGFDLVILGMGEDGHTASLFPGAQDPDEDLLPVLSVSARYKNRPADRITLTPMVFNSARNLIFLVSGEAKAAAVRQVFSSRQDLPLLPAQRILPRKGKVFWQLDSAAAKYLQV